MGQGRGLSVDAAGARRWSARTAWLSFLVGQLAIPWLLIPVVCGGLLYLQARLGIWKPVAMASTARGGVLALVQAVMALRLIPLGVRLLMRDARACKRAGARARFAAIVSASVLAGPVRSDGRWGTSRSSCTPGWARCSTGACCARK